MALPAPTPVAFAGRGSPDETVPVVCAGVAPS